MKPINEMNLAECIIALRNMPMQTYNAGYKHDIAYRIHDLTRWIPVSERMPDASDVNQSGFVRVCDNKGNTFELNLNYNSEYLIDTYGITHWRRIDKPEGV